MQIKKTYGAILLVLISFARLNAQNFSSIHYSEKDGLPSNTVYDITQDKDGFIWFGTENGLSRFDGKNFKTLTTKDGIPDNAVLKVHGDKTGRVYFSPFTYTPYCYYKDSIYKLRIPDQYKVDMANASLYYTKGDQVIIVGINDTYISRNNDSVIPLHDLYKKVPAKNLTLFANDTLIITGNNDSLFSIKNDISVTTSHYSREKKLLYAMTGQPIQINSPSIKSISNGIRLANNMFVVCNDNTVFFLLQSTGHVLYKIKIEKFSNAFVDNENNLWITTLGNGVYRFPSFDFRHTDFGGTNEIYTINNFNNTIIAGSDFSQSFVIRNEETLLLSNYSYYLSQSDNPVARTTKRNRILKFLPGKENLFIGADAFLLKIDRHSRIRFSRIFPIKDIDTAAGQLLVCTGKSSLLLDEETLLVKDTLLNQRSTCGIFYQGDYYIGTIGGLVKIDSKSKRLTMLGSMYSPLKSRIAALSRGRNNDLWIATSGLGLVHYKNGKVINVLNTETGISSDICTSLFVDSNEVWLGTSKGLNRIIPRGENWDITSITIANGLAANFINSVYVHNNVVYTGTSAGLTYFNKNSLSEKSICRLHITGISAGNNTLKKDSILSFPHNTLNIKIEFTAISFKSAGDIRYYHRLKGLEDDWNVTTDNFVNYSTLPPGDYTLMIKAINKFGVESETKEISIRIHPAWWQTWPFWLAVIGLLLLLIAVVYRRNIHSIRKKEKLKRETEARFAALEQQALQAQMNPHFIFNSLNSIQSFILDLDVEGANKYLTTFASLIRQTLDNSSSPLISLSSELKYLDTYLQLEKLRFKDKFNYTIQTGDDINQQATLIPGMLIQPYVENSLRHGIQHRKDNQGIISIEVTGTTGGITYTIKDNGVGRKKSEELKSRKHIEYQSKGTAISLKRINAINNQFGTNIRVNTEDITGPGGSVEGTIVTLFIPHLNTPVL